MLRVSAPGKIILMGEHAAVYGHPALVAAIDRRLEVVLEAAPDAGVHLDLAQIGIAADTSWQAIHAETSACRRAWEVYHAAPSPERFAAFSSQDPARVVRVALGEALRALGVAEDGPSLQVRIRSDIPVGAGFGSSAAVAVAVVAAVFAWHAVTDEPDRLRRAALEVERRQHGMPSGVDSRAVEQGGLLWVTRGDDGVLAVTALEPGEPTLLDRITVYDTGPPAETTGAVVAAVRGRRDADEEAIDSILRAMAEATRGFRAQLESSELDHDEARAQIRCFEAGLETLGVVPRPVREVIRVLESAGAAAKISGAGALSGPSGGSLLVYDPGVGARESIARHLVPFSRLGVRLGAPGVRREFGS